MFRTRKMSKRAVGKGMISIPTMTTITTASTRSLCWSIRESPEAGVFTAAPVAMIASYA
ncbi:hypothetical protein D3C87_1978350 [compost metagenome]